MYKCTECGMEYEGKPDYCDCGNDEFVLTIEKEPEPVANIKQEVEPAKMQPKEQIAETFEHSYNYDLKNITKEEKTPIKYTITVAPFAIIVFAICLILSFLIIFVWNPQVSETAGTEQNAPQEVNKNIPSIDKLWKESVRVEPVKKEEPVKKQEPVVTKPTVKKVQQTAPAKKQQQKKTTTSQPAKKTTTQKTVTQKPAVQTPQKPAVQQPSAQEIEAQKAAEAAKRAAEAKQKAEAEAKAAAEKARQSAAAKQEYANYKIALRNTISKKIDFTKVIGDGSCVVSFKLDTAGNLINRTFAQQSSNLTLNNAVYKAVMATPNFTQPPSAYKNETLRLSISFNNGNFAITLE